MSYDIDVCTDCHFAHHYGARSIERPATELELAYRGAPTWDSHAARQIMGLEFFTADDAEETWMVREWFSGESDQRCEGGRPLSRVPDDADVSDNTCSNHRYQQGDEWEEANGIYIEPCQYCGSFDVENGITEFTWSSCEGCGSHLGGSRYRLHIHTKEDA